MEIRNIPVKKNEDGRWSFLLNKSIISQYLDGRDVPFEEYEMFFFDEEEREPEYVPFDRINVEFVGAEETETGEILSILLVSYEIDSLRMLNGYSTKFIRCPLSLPLEQ